MASIKEVAKHAGVAISTVSKVLNNYPNVSEETKEKVKAAIEELGYVPNAVAAALSSKKSGRIAIILRLYNSTQSIDEVNMQYLYGALNTASELGLDVVTLFYSTLEGKSVEEMVNYLKSQSISGFIICGMGYNEETFQELVASQQFKVVSIDATVINESTSYVTIDQKKAQYEVAKKTMEMDQGPHKKLLYISGMLESYVAAARVESIKQFANDYDMELTIRNGDFVEKVAREITLKEGAEHDMIVCASDLMAIGAMRALIDMDIFRPVCGFDGISLMGYVGQQMNTVKQDFRKIAQTAVQELKLLLDGGEGRAVLVDYELVRLEYSDVIRYSNRDGVLKQL